MFKGKPPAWANVVKSEMLAAGLERAQYKDGAPPQIKDLVNTINSTVRTATIGEFQTQLKTQTQERADQLADDDRRR